jgi:rhodanese-related sulfurtransferase
MRKKMLDWMLLLFVVPFLLLNMTLKPAGSQPADKSSLLKQAKATVKSVSAADVKAAIDKNEKAIYLDVRTPEEYESGHLPGAINVSNQTLKSKISALIPDKNTKIYVYCQEISRSPLATKTLSDLGYKNAVLMDARLEDWIKAGYPMER